MRTKSTYNTSFIGEGKPMDERNKIPDNLKTGSNWFGSTTYGNVFQQPNPEDYAKKYKITEKLDEKPDDKHQYGKFILIQKPLTETALFLKMDQYALQK